MKKIKFFTIAVAVVLMLGGAFLMSAHGFATTSTPANILAEGKSFLSAAPVSASPGENVSIHARVVCTPVAGLYENPDPRRKIRNLPYGKKIGFRGHINAEWSRVEVYGAPNEGRWGFMRRSCVGAFNSW